MPGMGNGERDNALKAGRPTPVEELLTEDDLEIMRCEDVVERVNKYVTANSRADALDRLAKHVFEPVEEIGTPSFHLFETLLDEAHPSSKKFYDYLIEAALLHAKKQKDYGSDKDPFANVRASEEWGIPSWIGACVRLNDKVRRLQSLSTKGSLVNESVRDSFLDIAVYSLVALVLYEEQA